MTAAATGPPRPTAWSASLRAALTWQAIAWHARLRGRDVGALGRVREMIRVGAGAQAARYEQALQTPPAYLHGLTAKPWHEADAFESAARMRAAFAEVALEARRAYDAGLFVRKQSDRIAEGAWSACYLAYLGAALERNCAACPHTAALIESLPDASSFGLFYFCALEPRSSLVPHVGHTNTKLRVQLNLDVPEGCSIRVGDDERSYRTGECLVLDESFGTIDRNRGDRTRLALSIDVWHPDLTPQEVAALDAVTRFSLAVRRRRRKAAEAARTGAWN